MAIEILKIKNETELKKIILDYLRNNKFLKRAEKIKVFNPLSSFILNMLIQIPRNILRLTETNFYLRNGFIKENKFSISNSEVLNFLNDTDLIFLTAAISKTNLMISKLEDKKINFYCIDCQMSFSVFQDDAKRIWTDHLLTKIHGIRSDQIIENLLPLNCLQDEPSKYQPKPYDQENKVNLYSIKFE